MHDLASRRVVASGFQKGTLQAAADLQPDAASHAIDATVAVAVKTILTVVWIASEAMATPR
jgi:hypothetical protein